VRQGGPDHLRAHDGHAIAFQRARGKRRFHHIIVRPWVFPERAGVVRQRLREDLEGALGPVAILA
jgi:hypothetical protein